MRKAFAHRGFPALFAGTTTSMLGDSIMLLVFSMWVKELTGSNGLAGLTFFWMVVPTLFAPLLGGPIDRVRRKPLLVWGNVASAVMVLPLLLVQGRGQVWIIWSVAFLYGISFVVLPAALNGLLKELLPEDQLVDANASLQTVKEAFRLVGPLIGAGLYGAFGGWAVALVDAASFVLAALFIWRVRVREERPVREEGDYWTELTAGVRHLAGEPVLKHVLVAFACMLLVIGFAEASIFAILDAFGRPVEFASVIVTVQGVGAVVGGLMASRVVRRYSEPGAVLIGLVVLAMSLWVVAAATGLPALFGAVVVLGWSLPVLFVAYTTLVQRRTPQRLMGRVGTALEVVLGTPQAVSLAVGAALVSLLSYHVIFAVMGAVTLLGAVYLLSRLGRAALRPAPVETGDPGSGLEGVLGSRELA
ncbi:MAG TPA: MFS transporter [Dermatophilaceae bacterium]|nr:MFS transporter [Dermatophilaceae bacterium]